MPRKRKKAAPKKAGAPGTRPMLFVEVRLADRARLGSGPVEVAAIRADSAQSRAKAPRTADPAGSRFHEYAIPKTRKGCGLTKAQLERALPSVQMSEALACFAPGAIVATRDAPAVRAAYPGTFDEADVLDLAELARAVRPQMTGFGPADLAALVEETASESSKRAFTKEARTTQRVG